jgi:hypothetical protein
VTEGFVERFRFEWPTTIAPGEERVLWVPDADVRHQSVSTVLQAAAEIAGDGYEPGLAKLAVAYGHDVLMEIDVLVLEREDFSASQTCEACGAPYRGASHADRP